MQEINIALTFNITFKVIIDNGYLDKYKGWKASRSIKVVPEIPDEVVKKSSEFAVEAAPTRLLTHRAKSDSVKL